MTFKYHYKIFVPLDEFSLDEYLLKFNFYFNLKKNLFLNLIFIIKINQITKYLNHSLNKYFFKLNFSKKICFQI